MKKIDELKEVKEHMENRTQWHSKDVAQVEQVRNKVDALQHDGQLSAQDKQKNKVKHKH